jgi:hypothetical protein
MKLMKILAIVLLAVVLCAGSAEATRNTVAPLASVTVQVPAGQSINVFSVSGSTRVFKQSGGPSNSTGAGPVRYEEETGSPVIGNEVTFGVYTNATKIRIDAGPQGAWYNVGALAVANPILNNSPRLALTQFSPVAYNAAASIVSNDLMNGLITTTQATGATIALTLPTGALLDAASGIKVNQAFEWSLINLSAAAADSVTITASSGHTIVGAPIVISAHVTTGGAITSMGGNSSTWITRKTAANTFVTYRKN